MDRTDTEVQQGLQRVYDAHRAGDVWVSDCTLLTSGFEADIFAFVLHTRREETEAKESLVLRLFAGEGGTEKAAREFDAMRRLQQVGYPVPRVWMLGPEETPFGRPFVIMERIDGVALGTIYWSFSEEQRQETQTLHWRLMARLHMLEGSAILPHSPRVVARDQYCVIDSELSLLAQWMDRLGGAEPRSLRDTLAWLQARRATVPCECPVVIHGDFHLGNILRCPDGTAYVIDWSNIRLSDCRIDLAWMRLVADLAGWGRGESQLPLYEQWIGKTVSGLEYFEALVRLRLLLSVLISLRFGSTVQGLRPEVEAGMRREADSLGGVVMQLYERTGVKFDDFEEALGALLAQERETANDIS